MVTAAGVFIGLGAVLPVTHYLRSQLFGVSPCDPLTLSFVLLVLMTASLFPARRAASVDPLVALRSQ